VTTIGYHRLFSLLALILAASVFVGCSDDDDPCCPPLPNSGIVGTWVGYQGLMNGSPEPDGGSYGEAGSTMTLRNDYTGTMWDISTPNEIFEFTWSVDQGVVTAVSQEFGTQTASYTLNDDDLAITVVESDGTYTSLYRRHVGPSVLHASWQLISALDDYQGIDLGVDPHTLQFAANGQATMAVAGQGPEVFAYTTDGIFVDYGNGPFEPYNRFVYTVVGNVLYLVVHVPGPDVWEDVLVILKYQRM